jgi:hypothetical protein
VGRPGAPRGVGEYVSHIQSLPPRELVGDAVSYYIDATMSQYFDDYARSLGRRIRAEAVAREKEAYEAARFVVCMSRWCAEDVKASYGISPEKKVRVILPGANIDDGSVPAFGCLLSRAEALGISTLECLRLGVPVIATAVGGIIDTVPRGAGLLMPTEGTSERLADELAAVLETPERYARMRVPTREVAGFQSWDRAAREFLTLLETSGSAAADPARPLIERI